MCTMSRLSVYLAVRMPCCIFSLMSLDRKLNGEGGHVHGRPGLRRVDLGRKFEECENCLQTLRDNSLSANPSKTELAMEEIEYLGFRLSQQGG